jgi:nitrate/nitrite-specific signal transduction histidine kinase
MLRRKFLLALGIHVALLVAAAITAILLLSSVLRDLDAASAEAIAGTTAVLRLETDLAEAQSELLGPEGENAVARLTASAAEHLAVLGSLRAGRGEAAPVYSRLRELLGELAAAGRSGANDRAAAGIASGMRAELLRFDQVLKAQVEEERQRITAKFRLVALALGLVLVLVINASVMVLSRMVSIVLQPMDRLVEASRRLAREEFDYRVELGRHDEFDELARALNSLAAQLQANEQRKVETLQQVARAVSHEVSNALSIIELQLALATRDADGHGPQARRLREIHETLGRISRTIDALRRARRIVLTDYTAGVSMLDLERSAEEPTADSGAPVAVPPEAAEEERSHRE